MFAIMQVLVVDNDDEGGEEGGCGESVGDGVNDGAVLLLLGRVGWLEEESGFKEKDDADLFFIFIFILVYVKFVFF